MSDLLIPTIIRHGDSNPMVCISRAMVWAWVRKVCDDAGYSDRELCAVQISVEFPFADGSRFHLECPRLVAMVSNIPNSR
jgi:hypothetical protein